MPKTTHTHRGTCQACGKVQAVDNISRLIAKHGYTVAYGHFNFVCDAAGIKPAEHDVTYTHTTIKRCLEAAEWHDEQIPKLRSGEVVPPTFERWNANKTKIHRKRGGGTYETKGDYDTLPIALATPDERRRRIEYQMNYHQNQAEGLRSHVAFLRREVLPRFGKPLYPSEVKPKYDVGFKFTYKGVEHEIVRPAYSTFGRRLIGWYVLRSGAPKHNAIRWTNRAINEALNPKPTVVEGEYTTKAARKADLDKLSHQYEKLRNRIQQLYLALPEDQRTEGKNKLYWSVPLSLAHWRPKHAEMVLREFGGAKELVTEINALVKSREAVKSAGGA